MKKYLKAFVFVVMCFVVCCGSFVSEAAKKKVAVMPFESVSGSHERKVAEIMTDQVTVALVNSGSYTVLERTQLEKAIKEINFQNSGVVNQNQMIELGKMTGTDYTVVGKVLLATVVDNVLFTGYWDILGGGNPYGKFIPKYKGKVALDVRFIDNTTGELVFAQVIEGSKVGNDREVCLHSASRDAAANVLTEIQKSNPFTAVVLHADNGRVVINKGYESGVQKGEVLTAFSERTPVKDLDGRIVTVITEEVGKVKVTEVGEGYSKCKVLSGGDRIVRKTKVQRRY